MMLRKQEKLIIHYLIEKETWVSSNELSRFLNISIRTLRSRIKGINHLSEIIISSNLGYKISDVGLAIKLIDENENIDDDDSVNGRRNQIIKKLIQANEEISIYDLADELFVSDSTIQNDIYAIKKILSVYDITLNYSGEMVSVKTDHRSNYIEVMSRIVYQEANSGFISFDVLDRMFPDYDVMTLRKIIIEELAENHLAVNDYCLVSIILHFCIGFDLKDKFSLTRYHTDRIDDIKIQVTNDIIKRINDECGLDVEEDKINSFYAIIYQYTRNSELSENMDVEQDNEVHRFVLALTDIFYDKHFVDLKSDVFISGLTLHLEQLLAHPDRHLKNPLYPSIHNDSPIIYELAVMMAQMINERWPSVKLNEHEISYIAIHIGLAFEKKEREKIDIALINLNYNNSNDIIIKKIRSMCGAHINDISVYSNVSDLHDNDVDLIVSTIPINKLFMNSVVISLFFDKNDEYKLYLAIHKALENKKKNRMISIYGIFDKQFFTLFDDKEIDEYQIISKLCGPIVNAGIENKSFEKRVVDREKVSSTSYLNIAVPHCFEATSNKTTISIGLLKYPVKWGINTVNIVFLLSISRKDQKSFIKILERLIKIFTSEAWNKQYKRIDSYDKLMNFIRENES